VARFSPLDIVTLILPPSPTRPEALNMPPAEATSPFSIAIVKLAPLGQSERLDEIWTFQWPSKPVDASAGETEMTAAASATRLDQITLLKVIAPSKIDLVLSHGGRDFDRD
jgi:hypothetical protein